MRNIAAGQKLGARDCDRAKRRGRTAEDVQDSASASLVETFASQDSWQPIEPLPVTSICPDLPWVRASFATLLPLIVAGSIPGYEIEHPMAVVILGGLVTSTMLSLFVVPILYLRFGSGSVQASDGLLAQKVSIQETFRRGNHAT